MCARLRLCVRLCGYGCVTLSISLDCLFPGHAIEKYLQLLCSSNSYFILMASPVSSPSLRASAAGCEDALMSD